jgi:Ca2+/H+ antiporter, TMEM165/GDT1 family
MDLAVIAITFGAIFVVELPDKTFIAALVLSTRYKPLAVWIGVGLAFMVQTLVAVSLGAIVTELVPERVIRLVTLTIFLVGAVVLFRTAPSAEAEEKEQEEEYTAVAAQERTGLRAVAASFVVLFAAEWGDLSQILTINFVAHFDDHVDVFLGAWGALLTVSGLAVLMGRVLLRYMKLSLLHYIGAAVCLVLAAWTLYEVLA